LSAGSNGTFRVIEYSVQSNHVHAIVEANDERSLSRGMNGLATRVARGFNRVLN
jgi:REP element-mobilizing transposase RayT